MEVTFEERQKVWDWLLSSAIPTSTLFSNTLASFYAGTAWIQDMTWTSDWPLQFRMWGNSILFLKLDSKVYIYRCPESGSAIVDNIIIIFRLYCNNLLSSIKFPEVWSSRVRCKDFKCCASAKHHAAANLAGTGYLARSIWEVQLIDEIMVLDLESFSAYGMLYSDGLSYVCVSWKSSRRYGS